MTYPTGLPASVVAKIADGFGPIEDVVLYILNTKLPDLVVYTLIPKDPIWPFALIRRDASVGNWMGDPRFFDYGRLVVHVYAQDPDGDEKAAYISEAIRLSLFEARMENMAVPDRGHVFDIQMIAEPSRKTDWATSAGPVQFADLPTAAWRYETKYTLKVRKRIS